MRRIRRAARLLAAAAAAATLLSVPSTGAAASSVVATIPLSPGVFEAAVNPSTGRLYVTNASSDSLAVVDTATNSVLANLPLTDGPVMLDVNSVTNRVYVTHQFTGNVLTVLNGATNGVITTIPISNPFSPRVNEATNRVYIALTFGGGVTVVDGATNTILTTVGTSGTSTIGIAVDETRNLVYASDRFANLIDVIDGATNAVVATIPLSFGPGQLVLDVSANKLYVVNPSGAKVAVIDGATRSPVATIPVGAQPTGITVNQATGRVYVANLAADTVSVIDVATDSVVDTVSVGDGPAYPGLDSSTGRVYVPNTSGGTVSVLEDVVPGPRIVSVTPDAGSVGQYERFQASIELDKTYANPFDPNQIAVDVTFTAPSGAAQSVPAFWYQDFSASGTSFESYTPVGQPGWRVRFAPSETGTYQYDVHAVDSNGSAAPVHGSFAVTASSRPGFVHRDGDDPLFLRYDDGAPYMPIGHDAAFEDGNPSFQGGTQYYGPLFDSFGRAGENWTRVWMTDFNRSAIEWSTGHWSGLYGGVGRYSLPSAWRMDKILELAEDNRIEVQLVLDNHSQLSTWVGTSWNESPYNSANGGPVPAADPGAFFTNAAAKTLYKQRLRYLVARYGAYGSLLAWELLNEAQFTGTAAVNPQNNAGMRADVVAWHAEMGTYLHAIDPFQHLVTSSSSPSALGDSLNALPEMDLAQLHVYATPPALHDPITALQTADGKPVIAAEFGLSGSPENGFDPTTFGGSQADREHLVEGTHVHNAAWEAALSGSGAATWWWGTYVDADASQHRQAPAFPLNEHIFPPLVGYLAGEDWAALGLRSVNVSSSPNVAAVGLANDSAARVWIHDGLNEFGTGARPGDLVSRTISGATSTLSGLMDGMYAVDVWDTYGGGKTGSLTAVSLGGALTIDVPDFKRDVALKVARSVPLPDADGDGVADGIDTGNGTFSDGSTTGSIVDRAGLSVLVTDVAAPSGVRITVAGAGSAEAVFSACGFPALRFTTGSYLVTCGSVKVRVVTGSAKLVLGGGQTVVSVPAGVTAKVTDTGGGTYKVEDLGGGPVTVTVGGNPTTIAPGGSTSAATWKFVGFDSPVSNPPALNSFRAGDTVPLKWQLLRQDGSAVTGLRSVAGLSAIQVDCSTKAPIGSAASVSPVPKLDDKTKGKYQLVWTTAKSYAKTCRALTLDVGQGIKRQALFRFSS